MAVTGFEIQTRSLVLDGEPFGEVGAYEKIAGIVRFATEPAPRPTSRSPISTSPLATRRARWRRGRTSTCCARRSPSAATRRLLLDVPNRGRKVALGMFNSAPRVPDPTAAEDFGNGFLMRHGYTVAWAGWQHDVPRVDGLMALTVPRLAARAAPSPVACAASSGRIPGLTCCPSPIAITCRSPRSTSRRRGRG